MKRLLSVPGMNGHAIKNYADALASNREERDDTSVRNAQLKEIYLAKALFKCDPDDSFGREILSYDKDYTGDVHIGKIHHMHHNEEKSVDLNKDSFSSHVFITGSTGAGKSNAVYTILDSLRTTFMVVEPAKGEYKYAESKSLYQSS